MRTRLTSKKSGESGAGKTENTKKVIQYLAAVAPMDLTSTRAESRQLSDLSQQILRANPILEAFGNAQTVRNNNSSRFGKFIRIEFTRSGHIAGAYIDWYLLEKSRVVKTNSNERNYHVFYQLLRGADSRLQQDLLLYGLDVGDFLYTREGNDTIGGISDEAEWRGLREAFQIMEFSTTEQTAIFRTVAAVLLLGNVTVAKESLRADQATLDSGAHEFAKKACSLLGIPVDLFVQGLLHPRVKAGREWVEKVQTPEQVRSALNALSKGIYERAFGDLVSRINRQLDKKASSTEDSHFIGVLDIAGFEIFEENSFEQLCINYTNEKLQQFFNHHMFVLEQEEYAREQIEWKFIDFGKDLQPTIDLIELSNPIGLFSCLDEDSVMPKATDKSFTEKLHSLWERKTPKYRPSRLTQGFILTHYAAEVDYSTAGWLEKNKDPLNDNVTRLLASSTDKHTANLFADCADTDEEAAIVKNKVKKGLFRTVAQRHKEQLSSLMAQLHSTHPHFVRCILPNHKKKPKQFSAPLVLDQLRCNGVLEGIRIARTGFPNRLPFSEFRQRYEVLCRDMPGGYLEGQRAVSMMLEKLALDPTLYRVGLTKVFFRAGVLAELEEQRDSLIREIMSRFQSLARGFTQRRIANKRLYRAEATRIIQRNFALYNDLRSNPWWRLFLRMRPLLGETRIAGEVKKRDEMIHSLEGKVQQELNDRLRLEEERRRIDLEAQKVQKILESERLLALDKEEIFKRLQKREIELTEKLAGAIEDQEHVEDQLDVLVESKKKVEEQLEKRILQLEQAGQIITRFEDEKATLQKEIKSMSTSLQERTRVQSEDHRKFDTLLQDSKMLESQLHLKDRKVADLESKLLKVDQDLETKFATATKDLQSSRRQASESLDENRKIRKQLEDLSSTSTGYEDLMRRKESELSVLRQDQKRGECERKVLETEKAAFASRYDDMQKRQREVQAELDAMKPYKLQLQREVADIKRLLDNKSDEDAQANRARKMLEEQVESLKTDLYQAQGDLSRERQSRDDVRMLGDHQMTSLKEEFQRLNESKITIEKELYTQQDTLRRAIEAKNTADSARKEMQRELVKLRERFTEVESRRFELEHSSQRNIEQKVNEKSIQLRREIDMKNQQVDDLEHDRKLLADQVRSLTKTISESDNFRLQHDQHKERMERELVTVKGRLTASENDNRALLNKVQQKNLDIARSNSRAGESQRSRAVQLQSEKAKVEEDNRKLSRQLSDTQVMITSLEKQREKLALSVEDTNHELERERKTSRNAEKSTSTLSVQVAEANRSLDSERQMKIQAQANTKKAQALLNSANDELDESRRQLVLLQKVFDPESQEPNPTWEKLAPQLPNYANLSQQLVEYRQALRVSEEKAARAESRVQDWRRRFDTEYADMDARHSDSKRQMLEELNQNTLPARKSPRQLRKSSNGGKVQSKPSTPNRRPMSDNTQEVTRTIRLADTNEDGSRTSLLAELGSLQGELQASQMQNRHLQSQLGHFSPQRDTWQDDSPSLRRVQKLERENGRLHEQLDDSTKKMSALEKSLSTGELSLRDVQARSHEELFDLIHAQERSKNHLLRTHNAVIAELTEAKSHFDQVKQTKAALEVELRDARSDLREASSNHSQETASRSQLLQEHADLQIRFDAEASKSLDASSNLSMYKKRADEYFGRLEQAEITVLKATRAEQLAKTQLRESEETYATILAQRKQMDALVEDLQRQNQSQEEKVEDLAADLDSALQAKKRLQHELEDYRRQRTMDVEDKETSMEQTRRKYQTEFATLKTELEIERENIIHARSENSRLRDEVEELRSKWDDEVLNSSTWAKEKSRLGSTLQDLTTAREEAVSAHNEAQGKIVSLLSQVRNLRTTVDETAAERDLLHKEKRGLETRLNEAGERLEDLVRSDSPSMRNAAGLDREILEVKSQLAQQEDVAAAAIGKMRRAEAMVLEMQKDIVSERENNVSLHKDKVALEKNLKDLKGRVVDLETKGYPSTSQDVRFLNGRIKEVSSPPSTFHMEISCVMLIPISVA